MSLFDKVLGALRKSATEGAYRPGPYCVDTGWLPASWGQYLNYWQMGYDPVAGCNTTAVVEACVSAYAQTVAMCPLYHWRELANGGRERVTSSALSRINRAPNDYQSRSDFLLNAVRALYLDGNAYALALRNDRFEVSSLHGMNPRACRAYAVDGEIFYELGGNEVIDSRVRALDLSRSLLRAVPARDVLHIKLHHVANVLRGESPLTAAALAIGVSSAALASQVSFFQNQARPSGILSTDKNLQKPQVDELRERWNEQVKGLAAGNTPIVTNGLKFEPISMSAQDAQLAEAMKLSDAQVAQVFRVPLAIVGGAVEPKGSTEALMSFWVAGGLGFALDRVELALDKLFGLGVGEYSELDTSVLLRSNFRERIEGLVRGVQGGVFAPNEARNIEGLPDADGGDEPRVQQQLIPVSFATEPMPPAPPSAPPVDPDTEDELDDDGSDDEERQALIAFHMKRDLKALRNAASR